jgi:hypothetical protein
MEFMNTKIFLSITVILITRCSSPVTHNQEWPEKVKVVLDNTTELKYDPGKRLPLYLWPAIDPGAFDDASAEKLVAEFAKRGVAVISSWSMKDTSEVLSRCLPIARAQQKLGQRVNIEASDLMYSFFNGSKETAHIDMNGKPFFDDSFGDKKMGCPFTLDARKKEIREHLEMFLEIYRREKLPVDFVFTDWEVDGPLEVNRAYEASKRCVTCRKYLVDNFTFTEFQKKMREMRSYIERYALSEPILSEYPDALVSNYAVYPNDGYRYWYDYFEYYVDGQPAKSDQHAKYRNWYDDFPLTGFTYAMPVVYPWSGIFKWYDFENTDYRWFYDMLLNAGNAGKSTPHSIPVVSFVHWHTIYEGSSPDTSVKQMTSECYQELLWHMLLRGTDAFFLWAEKEEYPEEVRLLHEVYAEAQRFGRFLDRGMPVTFDVPSGPGAVISGLILGDSLLVRRTDFGSSHDPVTIFAGLTPVTIDYSPGVCKIIYIR